MFIIRLALFLWLASSTSSSSSSTDAPTSSSTSSSPSDATTTLPPPPPPPPPPPSAPLTSVTIGARHKLKATRHGVFLVNVHDTYVSRSLDLYGEWSEQEVAVFSLVVRKGDIAIDVGANLGAFTVPLANMVGSTGAVIAFEPQRPMFQLLSANVALNEFENVFAYNQAVGGSPGEVAVPRVNYGVEGNFGGISLAGEKEWASLGPFEMVKRVLLDDYLPRLSDCPSFVKVDVEGMEVDVLAGAVHLVERCRPVWHVENNCRKGSKEIIQFFATAGGYSLFWDVHTYFNAQNYNKNTEDVFTDKYLSMNVLAVPESRGDLLEEFRGKGMVEVDVEGERWYLEEYVMRFKGDNVVINQLGTMETCTR